MGLISEITLYAISGAFISGFLITAVSGSAKAVKVYLGILTALSTAGLLGGLIFSGGLLFIVLFQLITLVLVISFSIITGAVIGGGIFSLLHKNSKFKSLHSNEIKDYLAITEFSALTGITEERAQSRIKNGFYDGGTYDGGMYINKSELSVPVNE